MAAQCLHAHACVQVWPQGNMHAPTHALPCLTQGPPRFLLSACSAQQWTSGALNAHDSGLPSRILPSLALLAYTPALCKPCTTLNLLTFS